MQQRQERAMAIEAPLVGKGAIVDLCPVPTEVC